MAEFTFGQMIDTAKDAGGGTDDVEVKPGDYEATLVSTNSKIGANGKLSIGLRFRVDSEGESKGGGVWANQYLSPESPAALDIWFRTFAALGVPREHWGQFGSDLASAGADVATRVKGARARISVEIDGQYGPKVKRIKPLGGSSVQTSAPAAQGVPAPSAARPTTPF